KRFSVLRCFISIICVLFIVIAVGINLIYSQKKTPDFMERYFYIVTERDTNGISDVTQGAVIIAKDASGISIAQKDLVLCYPAGESDNLRLCGIFNVITDEDGTEKYQLYYDGHEDNTALITKDSIKAVCTGYPESVELGSFITFTRSIPGIVAELIIPCIILLVFFISRLASKDDEDEEIPDFKPENKKVPERKKSQTQTGNPLFEPSQEISSSDELERKKQSIAENFSQKKVNPNSPYQKEKERTMQFKASRPDGKNISRTSPAPSADKIREDIRRKNDYEGSHVKKSENPEREITSRPIKTVKPIAPVKPVSTYEKPKTTEDNTGIIPTSQVSEQPAVQENTRNNVEEIKNNISKKYEPKKSSGSPDISDILSRTETSRRKRNASEMSVDELLRIIEEEKKKL
ncbi:MAG: hypothetical protein K2J39_04950, partial [Ruminococcus sp.]|nr:hypothetical protein [Ruminococcus sp.]